MTSYCHSLQAVRWSKFFVNERIVESLILRTTINKDAIVDTVPNRSRVMYLRKAKLEEIIDVSRPSGENTKRLNELMVLANAEKMTSSREDVEKVLFMGIDFQNDFMENGELGVPNSHKDIERVTKFLYQNLDKVTTIALSLDTHELYQIF